MVPPEPGNFSALAMLMADARLDTVRTFLADFDEAAATRLNGIFAEVEASSGGPSSGNLASPQSPSRVRSNCVTKVRSTRCGLM
jgi:N-methylhydantoinase A/oxoprolinase/acetone carboxylase beta subunit